MCIIIFWMFNMSGSRKHRKICCEIHNLTYKQTTIQRRTDQSASNPWSTVVSQHERNVMISPYLCVGRCVEGEQNACWSEKPMNERADDRTVLTVVTRNVYRKSHDIDLFKSQSVRDGFYEIINAIAVALWLRAGRMATKLQVGNKLSCAETGWW